jgi:subtilisin family serine protease
MLAVLAFFSCGHAGSHSAGSQLTAAPSSSPSPPKAIALTGAGAGGGMDNLDGGTEQPEPEQDMPPWDIRDYEDPVSGLTVPIIDGRVIICIKDPPPPLLLDPNYFDGTGAEPSPSIYPTYPAVLEDPRVVSFLSETGAVPITEWLSIRTFAVYLPESISVEDAVADWPSIYSNWMDSVQPDFAVSMDAIPNDHYIAVAQPYAWHLLGPNNPYQYGTRVAQAWDTGTWGANVIVAVIDSGVQRSYFFTDYVDFQEALTTKGSNVGDDSYSTEFTDGGGQGWAFVRDSSQESAKQYGHGTLVAGALVARANNDPGSFLGGYNDIAGVARLSRVFPIAVKMKGKYYSTMALLSAYEALGAVKRVYNPLQIWRKKPSIANACPRYNVEILNMSYSSSALSDAARLHLDRITPFILCFASAGNQGVIWPQYPAAHSGVLGIAAYGQNGLRANGQDWATNFGPWVFVAAPTNYASTDAIGWSRLPYHYIYGWTDSPDETWGFSGTSASSPIAAGIAALVQGKYLTWTPQQVRNRLADSIVPLPDINLPGRLDAMEAVQ